MNEPLFADQLVAAGSKLLLPRRIDARALQARIRRAERLVFDKEASMRVGEVIRDIPELLIEQIQFARAPFDLCWIEFQSEVLWQAIAGPSRGQDSR
jgi:hypothetical protein